MKAAGAELYKAGLDTLRREIPGADLNSLVDNMFPIYSTCIYTMNDISYVQERY